VLQFVFHAQKIIYLLIGMLGFDGGVPEQPSKHLQLLPIDGYWHPSRDDSSVYVLLHVFVHVFFLPAVGWICNVI